MTKIALLHYSTMPIVGGVESVMGHHADLMADNGYEVCIVAGRGGQMDERIPYIHLPLLDSRHEEILAVKSELDAGRVPSEFEPLVGRIQTQLQSVFAEIDIVIAHNVCSLHKNLPLTAALWNLTRHHRKPRLILWHHDLAWTTPRYERELYDGHPWNLLRTNWKHAKQVVVSEMRQQELAKLLGIRRESVAVVPNGVDAAKFFKLEETTRALIERLNLMNAIPLILLPVRITPRKNIELALRVLARLREDLPDANLVVTGPLGPHNPANVRYFERLCALRDELGLYDSAHFLAEFTSEYIPDAVISDFYRLADVLFMPSREEGFGIPILEAGLSGLPIFCTDIPPLHSLGGTHATYFLPDANPRELANVMAAQISSNPAFNLRSDVRRSYTWERIFFERIVPLLEKR